LQLKGKNITISVLIPFKNEEKYLQACIESVRSQTFRELDIVLVDDHSSDNSHAIAQKHVDEDARIRLFKNRGEGLIDALKTAFDNATGTMISRMDADDENSPFKYEQMMEAWDGRGTVACGRVVYDSDNPESSGFHQYGVWLNRVITNPQPWQFIYQECIIPSPSWLIHRQDLIAIGGICAGLYPEDYELAFRMYQANYTIKASRETVHLWRDHPERNSRTNPLYQNNFFPELKAHYFKKLELRNGNKAVVWGAGKRGKQLVKELIALNIEPLWITNNPNKAGRDIYGIIVQNESAYVPDAQHRIALVMSADDDREEVLTRLNTFGMQKGVHYWFFC
jgi:glycosyltransferase involved in cell wall biosynthesis